MKGDTTDDKALKSLYTYQFFASLQDKNHKEPISHTAKAFFVTQWNRLCTIKNELYVYSVMIAKQGSETWYFSTSGFYREYNVFGLSKWK